MNRRYLFSAILLMLIPSSIGCGGSSEKAVMTPTQAQQAFDDLDSAFADWAGGIGEAHSAPVSRLRSAERAAVEKAILKGVPVSTFADSISFDRRVLPDTTLPAYTFKCPAGGNIVVTGSYTETSTSASLNIVETINGCSENGVTFSGDPNVALSDSASDNGTTTSVTLIMTGGFTVGSSSCSINVNASGSASDKTGSGTITVSGSVCGQSISASQTITD